MKPFIALVATIMLTANPATSNTGSSIYRDTASVGGTGQNAKNFNSDFSNDEDPAEFAQDLLEMGIDSNQEGYAPGEESPLRVVIDKPTQTITVSLNGQTVIYDRVSTGGTLKSPNNPANPKAPRCGNTPEFDKYIPASPQTMYPVWKSNTYVHADSLEPIAMPYAIHIYAGFFLHEVPPGMEKHLGTAVSGGCIRLPSKVARNLYALMKQHGGIHLVVQGQNPSPVNNLPPYNHICKKDETGVAYKVPVKGGAIAQQRPLGQPIDIRPTAAPRSNTGFMFGLFD